VGGAQVRAVIATPRGRLKVSYRYGWWVLETSLYHRVVDSGITGATVFAEILALTTGISDKFGSTRVPTCGFRISPFRSEAFLVWGSRLKLNRGFKDSAAIERV